MGVKTAAQRPSPLTAASMHATPATVTDVYAEKAPSRPARKIRSVVLVTFKTKGGGAKGGTGVKRSGGVVLPQTACAAVSAQFPYRASAFVGTAPQNCKAARTTPESAGPKTDEVMTSSRPAASEIESAASGQFVPCSAIGIVAVTKTLLPATSVHVSEAAPLATPKAGATITITGTFIAPRAAGHSERSTTLGRQETVVDGGSPSSRETAHSIPRPAASSAGSGQRLIHGVTSSAGSESDTGTGVENEGPEASVGGGAVSRAGKTSESRTWKAIRKGGADRDCVTVCV